MISGMARAQDLDAEIDSFDRQLGGGNFDVRILDLATIVGKNSDANSSGVPDKGRAYEFLRYLWTQNALEAGRDQLIRDSESTPAMVPYIKAAYVRSEFDRLDNYFAKFGFANNDVADALSELVVICWEFVNQGLPNVPTENSDWISKIGDEISQRIADSGALAVYSDTDKQMLAESFKYQAQFMSNLHNILKTTPNPKLQKKLQQLHRRLGESIGLDFVHLKIGESGFEKR
jgi:hypothetical protein